MSECPEHGQLCTGADCCCADKHAPMIADVQRELAEGLRAVTLSHRVRSFLGADYECACGWVGPWQSVHQAEMLVPTVQALIADAEKRTAARALREAADALHSAAGGRVAIYLRDQADTLDPK